MTTTKIIWNQLFSRIPFSFKGKIKNKKIYGIKKSLHWLRDSAEMLIYEYLYLKVKQTFLKYLAWTLGFCDALRCLYVASGSGSGSASASASVCVFTTISQICICMCTCIYIFRTYVGRYVNMDPNMLPYCTWLHDDITNRATIRIPLEMLPWNVQGTQGIPPPV